MTEESTSPPSEPLETSTGPTQRRHLSSDQLPDIVLPEPSRIARVMMTLRAIGILLGGVGLFVASLVLRDLYQENRSNDEAAACRASIADDHNRLLNRIDALGWTAMLALFRDQEQQLSLHAATMEELLLELPASQEEFDRRAQLCS